MHRLAAHLGKWIWEVEEIPASRLNEYMAMYQIDPWGEERGDLRAGIVASTIYNTQRQKGQRAMKAGDFMPDFGPRQRQTSKEHEAILTMFAHAHNATLETKSNGKNR